MRQRGDQNNLHTEISEGLEALYEWAAHGDARDDLHRPEYADARIQAIAWTINRATPPAFFTDQTIMTWMLVQAGRLWAEHGPAAALIGPLSHASFVTTALRGDYRTGNTIARRVLQVGEARKYEPDTSQARFTYSLSSAPWFESLEDAVLHARQAHEGLVRGGDLHFASNTYYTSVPDLLDCAPTLDELLEEIDSALDFCARTSNEQATEAFIAYRQLVRTLRGETEAPGSFTDSSFDEASYVTKLAINPVAAVNYRVTRSLAAVLLGRMKDLHRHIAAAMPLMPFIQSTYVMAPAHTLRALSLAHQSHTATAAQRDTLLDELDTHCHWLAARATDSPDNFRHLLHFIDAERAWTIGDFRAAARAFDAAQRHTTTRQRPWHRALILERTASFYHAHGIDQTAVTLLSGAKQAYEEWGATARVEMLATNISSDASKKPVHAGRTDHGSPKLMR